MKPATALRRGDYVRSLGTLYGKDTHGNLCRVKTGSEGIVRQLGCTTLGEPMRHTAIVTVHFGLFGLDRDQAKCVVVECAASRLEVL